MSGPDLARIVIGHGEFDHLAIQVTEPLGEDWFGADVRIACRVWSGAVRWQFRKGELRRFAEEVERLYRTLSGTATLKPLEPNLQLEMAGDGRGHITVSGEMRDEFASGTYLIFTLDVDQTELPGIATSLFAADP